MTYALRLNLTPRVSRMLDAAQLRAEDRGDGYFGAEHLLEAILEEPDCVPAQLISKLGVTEALRQELTDYFVREADRRDQRRGEAPAANLRGQSTSSLIRTWLPDGTDHV